MSAVDFRISSAHLANDAYIVSLGGEVDLYTAPQLDQALQELTSSGARRVVIDLAGAAFIDSTVLGVLLNALTRLDAGGGELVLVSDDHRILKLLAVTGLTRVFRIEATLTEAIESLIARQRIPQGTA
jgi:anti-sigma B factor antagonist